MIRNDVWNHPIFCSGVAPVIINVKKCEYKIIQLLKKKRTSLCISFGQFPWQLPVARSWWKVYALQVRFWPCQLLAVNLSKLLSLLCLSFLGVKCVHSASLTGCSDFEIIDRKHLQQFLAHSKYTMLLLFQSLSLLSTKELKLICFALYTAQYYVYHNWGGLNNTVYYELHYNYQANRNG